MRLFDWNNHIHRLRIVCLLHRINITVINGFITRDFCFTFIAFHLFPASAFIVSLALALGAAEMGIILIEWTMYFLHQSYNLIETIRILSPQCSAYTFYCDTFFLLQWFAEVRLIAGKLIGRFARIKLNKNAIVFGWYSVCKHIDSLIKCTL